MSDFVNGKSYRCRVRPGSLMKKAGTGTPYIQVNLEVSGGDMAGAKLPRSIFLTDKTRESAAREIEILTGQKATADFKFPGVNFLKLDDYIVGKEVAAECQIRQRKDGGEDVTANRISDPAFLIPGAVEAEVAEFFGSTVTPGPDTNAFSDQY